MRQYLRHLANFAYVVQQGSLTQAAKKLSTTPSVLSQSLKVLENHYREPLLIRHKQGVSLTSRGEAIYIHCEQLLDAASMALEHENAAPSGRVRLTCVTEVADFWLCDALQHVLIEYPDIELSVHSEDTRVEPTREARDLFIRVSHEPSTEGLIVFYHYKVNVILAGSKQWKTTHASRRKKRHQSIIARDIRHQLDQGLIAQYGLSADRTIECDSSANRIQLAQSGICATYCLEPTARALKEDALVNLLGRSRLATVDLLIAAPITHRTPAVSIVADALAHRFEALGIKRQTVKSEA